MVQLFHNGTPEELEKCERIAKTLLGYAELPLGLRIQACIVLAGIDEPGYVEWAEEAVRVAELGECLSSPMILLCNGFFELTMVT